MDLLDDIEVIEPETPIQKFYSNTTVFLTGATTLLGRLLIEKLLRSCPNIAKIYILMRAKNGIKADDRFQQLLQDSLFNVIKENDENIVQKIVGIEGDCTLPNLGLNGNDKTFLAQNVNVVFHVAANFNFSAKLKHAISVNVSGTYEVLKLCENMINLKSFVYLSSAFSQCKHKVIPERYFRSPREPIKLMDFARNISDKLIGELTPQLLGKYPNTYTFTKAVAEELVREFGKKLPVGIIRPSIVVSTYREPYGGYINALHGPCSIITAASLGLLATLHCDGTKTANIVPADMCVNAMIAISVDANRAFNLRPEIIEVPIYHFESSQDQPITWSDCVNKTAKNIKKWPTMQAVWYFSLNLHEDYGVHLLAMICYHFIPGLFCDMWLRLAGRQPWLTKSFKSIFKSTNEISYLTTRSFTFVSKQMHYLIERMTEEDKKLFFCDLRELHWDEYFESYVLGLRVFILKDPIKTTRAARKRFNRLYIISRSCRLIFLLMFIFLFYYLYV